MGHTSHVPMHAGISDPVLIMPNKCSFLIGYTTHTLSLQQVRHVLLPHSNSHPLTTADIHMFFAVYKHVTLETTSALTHSSATPTA